MGVRCADCGLLAVRPSNSHELTEAIDTDREGEFSGSAGVSRSLRCFVRAAPFVATLRHPNEAGPDGNRRALAVIWEDRECASFLPHWHGYSPKERLEMHLVEQQREWQAAQRQADLDRAERVRQEDNRQRWRLAYFSVFCGAVGFLIAWALGLKK